MQLCFGLLVEKVSFKTLFSKGEILMNKPNLIFKVAVFFAFCLSSLPAVFAQADAKIQFEPSYEVVLQVIVGSNDLDVQKSNLPSNLSVVTKSLKNNYSFSNFRINSTHLQRIANTGSLEFKSISREAGQTRDSAAPIFSEWTLGQLKNAPGTGRQNSIQILNFRFGQRVPIITSNSNVNYENIGLTLQKLTVPENIPTVVGSLSTSKLDEIIFLVLTVKQSEN